MTLPNFIIIGSAKCATSSVRSLVVQHPDIFLAQNGKEVQYFARDELYEKGLPWYESFFEEAGTRKAVGECSNIYTERERFPETAARMAHTLPDVKLIHMVRDPLPRIESFWIQLRSHGGEDVHHDFNQAVRLNKALLVDSSNYWNQQEAYRQFYPESQILTLFFEDYRQDPRAVMSQIFEFLGVDSGVDLDFGEGYKNPSVGKRGTAPWLSWLRRFGPYRMAKHLLPIRTRSRIRGKFMSVEIQKPVWDENVRQWVLEELRNDSLRLLEHCGKPAGFWRLD